MKTIAALILCTRLCYAEDKPIQKLAWLIGGVWTADASKMGGGMQRIETRYQWSDNASFIRFNTHFVTDKAELKTYDGNFFWNTPQATLRMWYMDSSANITEGPVNVEDDDYVMTFRGPDFEGKIADLRVMLKRKNKDLYEWSVAEKQGNAWKDLASLMYARTLPAGAVGN